MYNLVKAEGNAIVVGILVSNNSSNKVVTFWWPGTKQYLESGLQVKTFYSPNYKLPRKIKRYKKQFETVEDVVSYLLKNSFADFL